MNIQVTYKDLFTDRDTVLIGFSEKGKAPLSNTSAIIEYVAENPYLDCKTLHLDFDKNKALAASLGLGQAPSYVLFNKGRIEWQETGDTKLGKITYLLKLAQNDQLELTNLYGE